MCGITIGKYTFHEVNFLSSLRELNFLSSYKMEQIVKKTLRCLHHETTEHFFQCLDFLSLQGDVINHFM